MRPEDRSRVFGAATDQETLEELKRLELDVLQDGQISGLNGVLLSAAMEAGLRGACLLGEIPHIFAQFPFPKACVGVLDAFTTMAGVKLDLGELIEQSKAVEERLRQLLEQAEKAMRGATEEEGEGEASFPPPEDGGLGPDERRRIEELFERSKTDRSHAYELKRELDRLNAFKEYEDRFLDLFRERPTSPQESTEEPPAG
jgi:hypothetical protein